MGTYESTRTFEGEPEHLIAALTDVDAIKRWTPVAFQIADGEQRLRAGDTVRVEGSLLGRRLQFEVRVGRADATGLDLRASGPFEIDVDYRIDDELGQLSAQIQTRARRPLGRLLASATNAMLSAGALDHTLARLIGEARTGRGAAMCPAM